jgi:putative MATE family efflux protein
MHNPQLIRDFTKYTLLNVLGMVALSCYILADTFFVSKGLGTDGLTALNLIIPVYSLIHGSGLMLGMGGATKYAILKSQGSKTGANQVFTTTVLGALLIAAVFVVIGVFFSNEITVLLGADATVFEMTHTYLKTMLLFSPAFIFNDVLICFIRNDGNPNLSMQGMLCGSFSNIVLDYVFIFPFQMGIFGAVFATGLAPIISMAILSRHFLKRQNQFRLVKPQSDLRLAGNILFLGAPSLISEISSGVVILVFNTILLQLQGNTGVAAYGVIANLSLVVLAIHTGLAQGIQPLVSKAHGEHNPVDCRRLLRYAVATMAVLSCVIYLCVLLFPESIAQVFNSEKNPQLQEISVQGLRIYFSGILFAGLNILISVFFTSTEKGLPAHILSLLRGLILIIPMAIFLSAQWGVIGIWLAFPVTEIIVSILGVVLYYTIVGKKGTRESAQSIEI